MNMIDVNKIQFFSSMFLIPELTESNRIKNTGITELSKLGSKRWDDMELISLNIDHYDESYSRFIIITCDGKYVWEYLSNWEKIRKLNGRTGKNG